MATLLSAFQWFLVSMHDKLTVSISLRSQGGNTLADDFKIEMRTLIHNARKSHHISLEYAFSGSKSSLSRFETGKSELAVDVLQDVFERVGLSFFDLHVQTNDLTPLWQRTCDALRICIGFNDSQRANDLIKVYQQKNQSVPSPLNHVYMLLFRCMAALCELTPPQTNLLSDAEQSVIINFFKETQTWQMLEFTLFQYSQWFLKPVDAKRIFMGMCANINNSRLKDPSYLYRLAFFDAAIAYAQNCLLTKRSPDFTIKRLQETRLLFHTNTERQIQLQLIELVANKQVDRESKIKQLTEILDVIAELGMQHQHDRLHWWATLSLEGGTQQNV
jgi:flagellin-specific chaperone FliS